MKILTITTAITMIFLFFFIIIFSLIDSNKNTDPNQTPEQMRLKAYYTCIKIATVQTSKNIADCNLIK